MSSIAINPRREPDKLTRSFQGAAAVSDRPVCRLITRAVPGAACGPKGVPPHKGDDPLDVRTQAGGPGCASVADWDQPPSRVGAQRPDPEQPKNASINGSASRLPKAALSAATLRAGRSGP